MGGGKGGGSPSYIPPPTTDNSAMMQAMLDQQAAQNEQMMNMFMEMLNSESPVTAPEIGAPENPTKPTEDDLAFIQPIEDIKKEAENQVPEGQKPITSKPILDETAPVTTMIKSLLAPDEEDESST